MPTSMKKIVSILLVIGFATACTRKTMPTATGTKEPSAPASPRVTTGSNTPTDMLPPTATTRVANVNAMIVIDGNGRILTPKEKLPVEDNLNPDYTKIARAFTPAQKANLTLRYKTIPPKIIYVPEVFTSKSLKGTYIIYKKKFWYWKKEDGLFYLDETYYK